MSVNEDAETRSCTFNDGDNRRHKLCGVNVFDYRGNFLERFYDVDDDE